MAPNPPSSAAKGDRIAKLLARAGIASRREVERMIADGRVALNGTLVETPATILPSLRGVTVDGNPVAAPEPTRLFLFHKPTGLLVTERDPRGRPTIYDRLPRDLPRLVPVGRLDLNTEGLLLLTTDGGFKRQLELPSTGVERTYRVRAYGNVTQAQLEDLADGIEIEGIRYGSIDANIERRTGANVWIEMTLTEGKNREVRRVLEHLGLQVGRLIRTRYGPFLLGDLPTGEIGEVKQHELVAFRRTLKGGAPDDLAGDAPRPGFRTAATVDRAARSRERSGGDHPRVPRPVRQDDADGRSPRPARTAARRVQADADAPARASRAPQSSRRDENVAARAPRADAGRSARTATQVGRPDRAAPSVAGFPRAASGHQRRPSGEPSLRTVVDESGRRPSRGGDVGRPPRGGDATGRPRGTDGGRSPRDGGPGRPPRGGGKGGRSPRNGRS
ncbi:pseudouridine synthase [Sphingomonas sp. GV3]|uniref:pseudouridine synthase n=1 Tax=Sphingomonas sp. GV3 TaxID=3040671 RepID=UPI00280AF257|nr:pseudouridine synthase [Sphingomonas sp. GV3]